MNVSTDSLRINRFFTDQGLISRREADRAIEGGRVRINGRVAKLGDQVSRDDKVSLDGKLIAVARKKPVILAYYKPVGVDCTTDTSVRHNIVDAVKFEQRVFPVGRLDKDSEGLIFLTNMGEVVNKILRSENRHEKEYMVNTNHPITDDAIHKMRQGMMLDDGPTKPCRVSRINAGRITIILTEGRNRQIRRMLQQCGLVATRLKRMRIMNVDLGTLPRGEWRKLGQAESKQLFAAFQDA